MNCHFRTAGQMAQANDARRVYFFMIIRKNTHYVRVGGKCLQQYAPGMAGCIE